MGPILTDRPDTVGKEHLFMGFSYQHFNFNAIDGIALKALPNAVDEDLTPGAPSSTDQTFYSSDSNNVSFHLDQYVGMLTYGLTKSTDVSVIIPYNTASLGITSTGFEAYLYNAGTYTQDIGFPQNTKLVTSGSAHGIGDITINLKQLLIGQEGNRPAIAAGASFRIPSGDALNYLGSGAWGGNAYGLFEYRARLTPHLKLSYQWNNVSDLVTNSNTGKSNRLPGGLQYDAGVDFKIVRTVTLAADVLGSEVIAAPSVVRSTITLAAPILQTGATGPTLPPVASMPGLLAGAYSPYTTVNYSAGMKWSPHAHFLVYGNIMVQANNVGLRSAPVPLFGVAYNLKTRR